MIVPRYYQNEAVAAVYDHWGKRSDHPCIVLPTGAGKSLVAAMIATDVVNRWNGRIIILSHVREILQQNAEKIKALDSTLPVGIYSAGLKSRQLHFPVIVGGIQSVFRCAHEFLPFDVCLIDECHILSEESNSMYQKFIKDLKLINPEIKLVGMTATPFRLGTGPLCNPDSLLNHICYEANVKTLIVQGFLSRLRSRAGVAQADLSGVHIKGGEYIPDEMAAAFDQKDKVLEACKEIVSLTTDRKSILVFCSSVDHAKHVQETLQDLTGEQVGYIVGDTHSDERTMLLNSFKSGRFRFMSNCQVLTTGFDYPGIDCIALLRATLSPGLYAQMVGRGLRLAPEKQDALILDFGSNVTRHGTLDNLRIKKKSEESGEAPVKVCPQCNEFCHAGCASCPCCAFVFPPREPKHDAKASTAGIISGDVTEDTITIKSVNYRVHQKAGTVPGEAFPTMRVMYSYGYHDGCSEWVCVEHTGFAGTKARRWWQERTTLPFPESVKEAVDIGNSGGLTAPTSITVREVSGDNKFPKIVAYELGPAFVPGDAFEIILADDLESDIQFGGKMPVSEVEKESSSWVNEGTTRKTSMMERIEKTTQELEEHGSDWVDEDIPF